MKILIADDAMFMRNTIKNYLEKNGHEIVGEASNGLEAFEKYKELKPDMVTMDITMPELSGLESLKLIKNYDPNALVLMCTSMGQQCLVIEAMQLGAINFIVKPFQEDTLIKVINTVSQKNIK